MHFRLPPDFFRRVIGEKCIAIQELTLDSVDLLSTLQKISVSRTLQRLRLIRCNVNDSMPVVYVNVQNRFECLTHLTLSNLRVSLALLPSFSPSFSLKYLELSSCNRLVSDTDFRLSDLYTTALDSFRDGRLSVYDMRELLLPPPLVPCTPLQYHSFRRSIVTAEENAQHQTTRLKHLFLFPALEQLVFRDSPLTASFAVLLVRYMARFRDPSSVESHSRLRLLDLRGTGDALRGDTTAVRLIRALVPTTDVLADVPHHRDSSS